MKLLLCALIFAVLLFGSGLATDAQNTTTTATGTVTNKNQTNPEKKKNSADISKIDFNNLTFPVPNIDNLNRSVTLKNGVSVKKEGLPNFRLRKTYYFDLTGDKVDEAISHVIADGCQLGCESSSLFYIHTIENNQPKLLWKIAIGGDVLGGLKSAHFEVKEFIIETFGECTLEDWLIKVNLDMKKNPKLSTSHYTRFVFTFENGAAASKTILPLEAGLNPAGFRPKISFGELQ